MTALAHRDALLVYLEEHGESPERGDPPVCSSRGICEGLGVGDSMAERLSIVSTISELEDEGLLQAREMVSGGGYETRTIYGLSSAGESAAREVLAELSETGIAVQTSGNRTTLDLETILETHDLTAAEVAAQLLHGEVVAPGVTTPSFPALVGRDGELDTFLESARAVREDGRGRLIGVVGGRGLGKTALAETALDRIREEFGAPTFEARCRAGDDAYRPVRELLSAAAVSEDPFASLPVDLETPTDIAYERNALFHEAMVALADEGDAGPTVVFLDDVHLADRGTVAFLSFLADRVADQELLVVLAARPGELPEGVPAFLEGGSTVGEGGHPAETTECMPSDPSESRTVEYQSAGVEFLRLAPLDEPGIRTVVERTVGRRGAPAELVERVQRLSGGVPLIVEEIVAAWLKGGELDDRYRWYGDDDTDHDAEFVARIERQLDEYDPEVVTAMEWAAVVGDRVPRPVLEAVLAEHTETSADRVDLLVELNVLERLDEETVTFRADVLRDGALARLEPEERRDRHAVIASVMAAEYGEDPTWAGTVGRHHEAANQREAAIEAYRRAAREAERVYAHESAAELLERAVRLARDSNHPSLSALMEELGDNYRRRGALETATRHYTFARQRAVRPAVTQRLRRKVGQSEFERGRLDRSRAHFDEALELAIQRGDEHGEARVRNAIGQLERYRGALDEAESQLRRAHELAGRSGSKSLEADVLKNIASLQYIRGDLEGMIETSQETLRIVEKKGDERGIADSLRLLGACYDELGEYERAREQYDRSLEHYRRAGIRWGEARVVNNLGVLEDTLGNLDRARDHHETSLRMKRRMDDRGGVAVSQFNLGWIAFKRGSHEEARERLSESLSTSREVGDRLGESGCLRVLSMIDAEQGTPERARSRLANALDIATDVGAPVDEVKTRIALGRMELLDGARPAARQQLEAAARRAEEIERADLAAPARCYLAAAGGDDGPADRSEIEDWLAALEDDEKYWEILQVGLALLETETGSTAFRRALCDRLERHLERFDPPLAQMEAALETSRTTLERTPADS